MNKEKKLIPMSTTKSGFLLVICSVLVIGIFTLSSKSTGSKGTITAVLQSDLNIDSPSGSILAVSTTDQALPDGSVLPRGTKFVGKTSVEGNNLVVFFDSIQTSDGQNQQFIGKLIINKIDDKAVSGVSAKIGKTLYNQSKSNVLGAIFHNPGSTQGSDIQALPKGSVLKIEVD